MKLSKTFPMASATFAAALMMTAPQAFSQQPGGAPGGSGRGGGGQRGAAVAYDYTDNTGYQSLFDGKTLDGWEGAPGMWDVKDGAIHIDTACEHPTGTTYAYWKGGAVGDFVLKYDMKGTIGVNGGMQIRSFLTEDPSSQKYPPRAAAGGPGGGGRGGSGRGGGGGGAFGGSGRGDANNQWGGNIYEQGGRGIISTPGHALLAEPGQPVRVTATLADKPTLDSWYHKDDYNQMMVVAQGHTLQTFMNGHLIMVLVDNDPNYFRASGLIAIEVENTGGYWVRNIQLKRL